MTDNVSADDLLEQWLKAGQELLAARKGSAREQALEDRLAAIETRFEEKPDDEKQDALGDLDDDERELIRQHRAGVALPTPNVDDPPADDADADDDESKPKPKTRPGRRSGGAYKFDVDDDGNVVRLDIPKIYNGPDEPNAVELPGDDDVGADAA